MLNLVNTFVYGQMFFFMWLFNANIKLNKLHEKYFYILSFLSVYIIYYTGISILKYSNILLMSYVFFVVYTTYIFSNKYTFRQALALGFLIPFLNSYYWEAVLHFSFISFRGFDLDQIVQMFHLIPIIFLLRTFEFNKNDSIDKLMKGLIISFVIHYLIIWIIFGVKIIPHDHFLKRLSHMVIRFWCLNILIDIVYNAKCIGD